jgi:hypothetical protein
MYPSAHAPPRGAVTAIPIGVPVSATAPASALQLPRHGDVVQLVHCDTGTVFPLALMVEVAAAEHATRAIAGVKHEANNNVPPARLAPGSTVFGLAMARNINGHVRVMPNRKVDFSGGKGPWALFEATPVGGVGVRLRSIGHTRPAFLSLSPMGGGNGFPASASAHPTFAVSDSAADPGTLWAWVASDERPVMGPALQPHGAAAGPADAAAREVHELQHGPLAYDAALPPLTAQQLRQFGDDGYLILRGCVAPALVADARRQVNHLLGQGSEHWEPDPQGGEKEVLKGSNHPALLRPFSRSALSTHIQQLLAGGAGSARGIHNAQLAIRFPVLPSTHGMTPAAVGDVEHRNSDGWHIDGQGKDRSMPFSVLAIVALSDQSSEGNGNFTIYPGWHRSARVRDWYARHLGAAARITDRAALHALMNADRPTCGAPLQVCLAPGDAALVHPLLPHRVGNNVSPDVRYTLINRVQHRDADALCGAAAVAADPFLQFPAAAHATLRP